MEWAEGLRRIESLLTTSGRLMRVREIAVAIRQGTTPALIETTRGRCKHLVKAGKAVEVQPSRFRVAVVRGGGEVPDPASGYLKVPSRLFVSLPRPRASPSARRVALRRLPLA